MNSIELVGGADMAIVLQKLYTRNYWHFGAFGILFADYLATFIAEFTYIWRKPFTPAKITFWFSRYLGLFGQAFNCYLLLTTLSPTRLPIDHSVCLSWYTYQTALFWLLFVAVDVVLMLRIAAMYSFHRVIRAGLGAVLVIELGLQIMCSRWALEEAVFNVACEMQSVPNKTTMFGILVLGTQIGIWLLTITRTKAPFGIVSPGAKAVIRDGAWVALSFVWIFLFIIPNSLVTQVGRSELIFAWPTTLVSMVTCRLIVNMHEAHFSMSHGGGRSPDPERHS